MKSLICCVAVCALALTGTQVMAQDNQTKVTVRSAGTNYTPSGPAPEFTKLDLDGNGSIDHDEATGYKLLANDFIKADINEDGIISVSEYQRWAKAP